MKFAASLLLLILLIFLYNYGAKKGLNASRWKTAKVSGLLLMPLIAVASPALVIGAGLYLDPASFVDPKCGMPDMSFTFLSWMAGIPLSFIIQYAFNRAYYKAA